MVFHNYTMWKNLGEAGAETCLLINGLADGLRVPPLFNEAWLAVLPKGEAALDSTGEVVRGAGALRPLVLKNIGMKIVAASVARRMRPASSRGAHASERGFVSGRDLTQNVIELDSYARALSSTGGCPAFSPGTSRLSLPWCGEIGRAGYWGLQGLPAAAMRMIEATNTDISLLSRLGGVHELGEVTRCIAQGCPLSEVLSVIAMVPIGRRIHSTLRAARAGMLRQCADDIAMLLRSICCVRMLEPVFSDAGRFAGAHPKPDKCEVVMVGRERGPGARAVVERELRRCSGARSELATSANTWVCSWAPARSSTVSARLWRSGKPPRPSSPDRAFWPQLCGRFTHRQR